MSTSTVRMLLILLKSNSCRQRTGNKRPPTKTNKLESVELEQVVAILVNCKSLHLAGGRKFDNCP